MTKEEEKPGDETQRCANCGHDPNEDRPFSHPSGPFVSRDEEGWNREWVHARALRFYLHKITAEGHEDRGKWIIVDRDCDLRRGKAYANKKSCVNAFIREADAEANRKAIKEGIIRQSLGRPLDEPASETDREVAEELARQWDEEDVSCPKHKREKEDDES